MKRLFWLILIAVFFTVASSARLGAITVKHSTNSNDRVGRDNIINKNTDRDKDKSKRKSSRDANEPSSKSKEKSKEKPQDSDKGQDHQMQLKTLEAQMAADQEKWNARKAQLERTADQATQKGDKKRADLARNLLEKEQQQYDQKNQQMEERRQKLLDLIQQESPKDPNKPEN